MDAEQLVGASDISVRLGYPRVQDVHSLRRRDPTFPDPVAVLGTGPQKGIYVWYWPDVAAWARKKGIEPAAKAGPRSRSASARDRESEQVQLRRELAELAELRQHLGELSQLRERLEALEAGREDEAQPPAASED